MPVDASARPWKICRVFSSKAAQATRTLAQVSLLHGLTFSLLKRHRSSQSLRNNSNADLALVCFGATRPPIAATDLGCEGIVARATAGDAGGDPGIEPAPMYEEEEGADDDVAAPVL